MNRFLVAGNSWSGHERNCLYINTGAGRFANVGSAVGFDQPHDGRATGFVDWDYDGDLDYWLTNRDAPGICLHRNDIPQDTSFVAVRLIGETCNRDAVGARVVLYLVDGRRLSRTVHAGDGFASQSTRWLHMGLGQIPPNANVIEKLEIVWPGGERQCVIGLVPGKRYEVSQGNEHAVVFRPPTTKQVLTHQDQNDAPSATGASRTLLSWPIDAPKLPCRTLDDEEVTLVESGKPTLVVLWASWCAPCLRELQELFHRSEEIEHAGLRVMLLNAETASGGEPVDLEKIRTLLQTVTNQSSTALADDYLMAALDRLQKKALGFSPAASLPSSYLFNDQGKLAAVYRGALEVDSLLDDVELLSGSEEDWLKSSLPFEGRWLAPPEPLPNLLRLRF